MLKTKYLFVLLLIICCSRNNKTKDTLVRKDSKNSVFISGEDDYLFKEVFFDFLIPDTLVVNKEVRGKIQYYSPLEDSIKTTSKDMRFLLACLEISSKEMTSNELTNKYLNLPCDTLVRSVKNNSDTIMKPFYITPIKLGENYISGIVNDYMYLEAYGKNKYADSSLSRIINEKHCFQFKVYVTPAD